MKKKQYKDAIRYKLIEELEKNVKYSYKQLLKNMGLAVQKKIDKF